MKQSQQKIEQLLKQLTIPENELFEITSDKFQVKITAEHYVQEFFHPINNKAVPISQLSNSGFPIENRDKYIPSNFICAFQFFDLTLVKVNDEILKGTTIKKNESPIIYIGKRINLHPEQIERESLPFTSIIIDKDEQIHRGDSGITYQEYLDYKKEISNHYTRKKEKNL